MTIRAYDLYTNDQTRDPARKDGVDNKDGHDRLEKTRNALRGESINNLCEYFIER